MEIPHDTFNDCGKLREVILPHDTEVIGAHAFSGCAALEQVDLPESVKRMEEGAFVTCVSLEKVHLPKGTGGGRTQGVLPVYEFKRTSFPKTGDRVWQRHLFTMFCIKTSVYRRKPGG